MKEYKTLDDIAKVSDVLIEDKLLTLMDLCESKREPKLYSFLETQMKLYRQSPEYKRNGQYLESMYSFLKQL